jgi:hypothetical protein
MGDCDSCGIGLGHELVIAAGKAYCCAGCALGGPCRCTYEHDLGRYPPSQYARPVSLSELFDRYELAVGMRAVWTRDQVCPPPDEDLDPDN